MRVWSAAALLLLVACSAPANRQIVPNAPSRLRDAAKTATGIVIPAYAYPPAMWHAAIAAKNAHPHVTMAIIANVDNGPGAKRDPYYAATIEKAQKAGIWILGYVHTSYGRRSQTVVDEQMKKWYSAYHTDGIFLDEMKAGDPTYYRAATDYAHAHSLWFVMGNPGVDAPGDDGPDVINYFEQKGYPSRAFMRKPAHLSFGKARWSYIAGAVPFEATTIRNSLRYAGYIYATNGKEPECYCKLPSYFNALVALLDSAS
jgi:hypothetical protein